MPIDNNKRKSLQAILWTTPTIAAISLPVHAETTDVSQVEPPEPPEPPEPQCTDNVIETDSIVLMRTDFDETLTVNQYSGPGTLSAVIVRVISTITGELLAENMGPNPDIIDLSLGASIQVTGGSTSLPASALSAASSFSATAHDGSLDFGGTSGVTETSLTDTSTQQTTVSPSGYVGGGTVTFQTQALGQSTISGPGNLATAVSTFATVEIEVEYVCS